MKGHALRAAFLAAALVMLMPSAAHAQLNDTCYQYNCSAYAYYSSADNEITGYIEYWDDGQGWWLGIEAYVLGGDGEPLPGSCDNSEESAGWGYAINNCAAVPGQDGVWEVYGLPWYEVESWQEPDGGSVSYEVGVDVAPTGETQQLGDVLQPDPVGQLFYAALQPSYWNWDGVYNYVSESLGTVDDECYNTWHATSGPAQTQAAAPNHTDDNEYQDKISSPASYVQTYMSLVNLDMISCGWSVSQTMSYNGQAYVNNRTLSQTYNPYYQVQTCRGSDFCNTFTYTW